MCSRCVIVDEVDFSNVAATKEWWEGQTVEVRCAISSRAALRVCANLDELDDRWFSPVGLASFRALLISAVRGLGRTADVHWLKEVASRSAAATARTARPAAGESAAVSAILFAHSASLSASAAAADSNFGSTALAADCAARSARDIAIHSGATAAYSATSFDATHERLSEYHIPLWEGADVPPVIQDAHQRLLDRLDQDRATWGFWHDWYLAMWEGTFRDWDLATEVAKIPEDVWERGAEAVAGAIKIIGRRRELEQEIANLKDALEQTEILGVTPHRLHNQPPHDAIIHDPETLNTEITLIWGQLEILEDEIAKPEPEASKLNAIAQTLWDISIRISVYCGSLADIALKESAKTVGSTGTKVGIGLLATTTAAQNDGVKAVAKAIWEFVKTIQPG